MDHIVDRAGLDEFTPGEVYFTMFWGDRKAPDLLPWIGGSHHCDGGGFAFELTGISSCMKRGNPKVMGGVWLKIGKSGLVGIPNCAGGYEIVEFWIGGGFNPKFKLAGEVGVTLPIGWLEPIQGNGVLRNFHNFNFWFRQNLPSCMVSSLLR